MTDAFGAPVANQKVDFDITAGSRNDRGGLELDDAPTDARGEASFTYTDTGASGSDTIAAYVDNDANDQADQNADGTAVKDEAQASFDATPQPGSARNIRVSPAEATNPAGAEQVFTATVTDRYGNAVPDVDVAFS